MNKNSLLLVTVTAALILSTIVLLKTRGAREHTQHGPRFKIGIIQTASHPALDAVREGFVQRIKETVGTDVEFVVNNAQCSVNHAHAIVQRMHADSSIAALFAIATPAAQAAVQLEKEKPIIIAAVTDPHAAGLMNNTNVTGCSDSIAVHDQIRSLAELVGPNKTVALLFNSAECNSVSAANQVRAELQRQGFTTFDAGITSEADVASAVTAAARRADILLAPTDNTIASAIDLVVSLAAKAHKPLIVSDTMLLKHGALAAQGVDYREHGKQAGAIALRVLVDKQKPRDISIMQSTTQLSINKKVADTLKIEIPETLKKTAIIVE